MPCLAQVTDAIDSVIKGTSGRDDIAWLATLILIVLASLLCGGLWFGTRIMLFLADERRSAEKISQDHDASMRLVGDACHTFQNSIMNDHKMNTKIMADAILQSAAVTGRALGVIERMEKKYAD